MNNDPAIILGVVLRHLNAGQLDLVVGHLIRYLYVSRVDVRNVQDTSSRSKSRRNRNTSLRSCSTRQEKRERKRRKKTLRRYK